ncbi:MAG: class I SAM-dependent methyltransferase [Rhodocyclaceae bacterium]|nr:class I SAM-dependent methyltransferase [Rhodocyclaceae bacterium]
MSITEIEAWLDSPQGRYVFDWEQARVDQVVADIFGFNAVQVGFPCFEFLRSNRMPFRLRCSVEPCDGVGVAALPWELPFESASIDLVVLPHVLEFSPHPHQVLREVERILVPEGRVVVTGFNPYSLWGVRRKLARQRGAFPWQGQYLSVPRLKDWMTLLGMESQVSAFGCYAPAATDPRWIERWSFMDRVGQRWWRFGGGVYLVQAIKRVRGMRLIMPNWRETRAAAKRLSPAVQKQQKEALKQ